MVQKNRPRELGYIDAVVVCKDAKLQRTDLCRDGIKVESVV